jgi:hypothetical protein
MLSIVLSFYLREDVSETGLCLRFHVEPTQLDQTDKASLSPVLLLVYEDRD